MDCIALYQRRSCYRHSCYRKEEKAEIKPECRHTYRAGRRFAPPLSLKTENLHVKTTGRSQQARFLSGGNQQKVVLAKWLASNPRILVLDEPTRGIDVSAKAEIYALINNLTAQGMAILLVSSELPEIMGISDRIIVMHDGEITGEFQREEFSEQSIMTCAIGRRKE